MGRSGYSDDCEHLDLYRQAVRRATTGYRGQHLLCKLRDALDAMPRKRLITGVIKDEHGDVCALGALDPMAPANPEDEWNDELGNAGELGKHFKIASALASEIVYMNDEAYDWRGETPEQRWERMRAWVDSQIVRSDEAQAPTN